MTIIVIFFLTIQSSYSDNTEIGATDEVYDTVQFVVNDTGAWRIKTYATDQDVHVWSINATVDDIVALAKKNTETNYGDVLSEGYVIETADGIGGLRRELRTRGLSNNLEISKSGMFFWAPEGSKYSTKSKPNL